MEVILSKHSGFCFGVDNALKIADKVISENKSKNIYMLGDLVHNEEVIKKIKSQGIKLSTDIKKIPNNSLVILSAHGHAPKIYEQAKKQKLKIIDATCPMVKKVHILGKMLAKKGYFIIIVGDKKHQEVQAIYEQVRSIGDKVKIIENVEQARKINLSCIPPNPPTPLIRGASANPPLIREARGVQKIGIISQTTQPLENFEKIADEIKKQTNEIKICNTICDATRFRQSSAKELAKKVDLMIIIGSSHSANTKRLTQICKKIIETHQVNSANQLNKNWFKNKKTIGISAGASTPKWIIDQVIKSIKKF